MRLEYKKLSNDECIYVIPLYSSPGNRSEATPVDGIVTYEEDCVLEIKKTDGRWELVYTGSPRGFRTERVGNEIRIAANIPLQRLWICRRNSDPMRYKVPVDLPLDQSGKWRVMRLPNMKKWQGMKFCADKYFEKVYPFNPEDGYAAKG